MEIKVHKCAACHAPMKYGADSAGRKTKCPKCGAEMQLPKANAAPTDEDEVGGSYGLAFVDDAADKKKRHEAEATKKVKQQTSKVKIRRKNIGDLDAWTRVYNGLLFIMIGTCIWGAAYGLQGLALFLGMVQGAEIGVNAERHLFVPPAAQPPAEPGVGPPVNRALFFVSLLAGSDFAGIGQVLLIVSQVLTFIQLGFWMVGYGMCLAIEPRLGTRGQLITLFSLGGTNLALNILFRFLPLVGALGYVVVPYFAPEITMSEINTERAQPIHVTWSSAPMWEIALAVVVQAIHLLEPIMIAVFLWTLGVMLRHEPLELRAFGITKMGFGVLFMILAYHMYAVAGTSSVLIKLLRVIYLLWFAFQIGFIVRLATCCAAAREQLNLYLNPEP